jgi:hypothetical protein
MSYLYTSVNRLTRRRRRKLMTGLLGVEKHPLRRAEKIEKVTGSPDDTEGRVRNKPTQAKRRLEWGTPNFVAGRTTGVICCKWERLPKIIDLKIICHPDRSVA